MFKCALDSSTVSWCLRNAFVGFGSRGHARTSRSHRNDGFSVLPSASRQVMKPNRSIIIHQSFSLASATVPLGTPGRVWSPSWFLGFLMFWCLVFLFFNGPTSQLTFFLAWPAPLFLLLFRAFFQTSFLTAIKQKSSQNKNSQTAEKQQKLQKKSPKRSDIQDL